MPIGVIIDVTSIQKYVFGSNKLKDILGASFIVSNLYDIITKNYFKGLELKVGYIGGGNALVSFEKEENANSFIKEFTRYCLINFPGINAVIGTANIKSNFDNPNDTNFYEDLKQLFKDLEINKRTHYVNNTFYMPGFIADDVVTGQPLSIKCPESEHEHVSHITAAKRLKIDEAKNQYKKDGFELPDELNEIIINKGEDSTIAVVHIDGNGIGQRFKELKTLEQVRNLSAKMAEAVCNSFDAVLEDLIELVKTGKVEIIKNYLPIRPIILGGDDITFVTRGNLGLYLANLFIKKFDEYETPDNKKNSACAGVAIVNMKYPFYRAYKIAEELCTIAKTKRKSMKSERSFIDFHVLSGQQSTSIELIRKEQFELGNKKLLTRPFIINDPVANNDFDKFINAAKELNIKDSKGKLIFANNKLKDLRDVLFKDETQLKEFLNQLNFRDTKLPDEWGCRELYYLEEGKFFTPYLDLIEISEYYPPFELERRGNHGRD